jgi:uncharacterized membrane protein YeaQ/YmgE (transglycosylase-associated protein family)
MGILLWIIFGAIAGWVASSLMGTNDGLVMNIALGIIGAILGGWLMSFIGESGVTGFNLYSFLVAIVGAVVLISIARALR